MLKQTLHLKESWNWNWNVWKSCGKFAVWVTNQWLGVAVTCVFAHGWHNGTHLCQIGFATAHVQCEWWRWLKHLELLFHQLQFHRRLHIPKPNFGLFWAIGRLRMCGLILWTKLNIGEHPDFLREKLDTNFKLLSWFFFKGVNGPGLPEEERRGSLAPPRRVKADSTFTFFIRYVRY